MRSTQFVSLSFKASSLISQPYKLIRPELVLKSPPVDLSQKTTTGVELFARVSGYKAKDSAVNAYRRLTPDQERIFEQPPPAVGEHMNRIAQGYQLAISSKEIVNPYYDTWLYPWEIVKDKLRAKWAFGMDIYDILIHEALGLKKSHLTPSAVFRGECEEKDELLKRSAIEKLFRELSEDDLARYDAISKAKVEYYEQLTKFKSKGSNSDTAYRAFFTSILSKEDNPYSGLSWPEKNSAVGKAWKELPEEEKSKYKGNVTYPRGNIHREKLLDERTDLVMDYIFKFGEVENWTGDWRKWREEVTGGMYYLDKLYFPYVVQTKGQSHKQTIVMKGIE